MYVCIYIEREREKEKDVYIYIYITYIYIHIYIFLFIIYIVLFIWRLTQEFFFFMTSYDNQSHYQKLFQNWAVHYWLLIKWCWSYKKVVRVHVTINSKGFAFHQMKLLSASLQKYWFPPSSRYSRLFSSCLQQCLFVL